MKMKSEKLKLQQLVPYLPYGLQFECLDYKRDYVGEKYCTAIGFWMLNERPYIKFYVDTAPKSLENIKPILRPLSDLTKDINHNNETFTPYECNIFVELCAELKTVEYLCECTGDISYSDKIPYRLFIWLFEHHFDVFGLIDSGLAIDINALNQE